MRWPRLPHLTAPPGGLLTLVGLGWLVVVLTAGVWVLAGFGWALVTAAVAVFLAFALADVVVDGDGSVKRNDPHDRPGAPRVSAVPTPSPRARRYGTGIS